MQEAVQHGLGDHTLDMTAGQGEDLVNQELSGGSKGMSMGPALNKGGLCAVHGSIGIRKWKPVRTTLTASDGKKTTRVTRRYYWICEVGPGEMGTITWHFRNMGKDKSTSTFENCTTKEGQRTNCLKKLGVSDK